MNCYIEDLTNFECISKFKNTIIIMKYSSFLKFYVQTLQLMFLKIKFNDVLYFVFNLNFSTDKVFVMYFHGKILLYIVIF